jgi:hypothetical protein
MKSLSDIGKLVVILAMGLSFARCSDDTDITGVTVIDNKTYTFRSAGRVENYLWVVPFDSTWGYYFYDGHNKRRLVGQGDYFTRFDPKTGGAIETIGYGSPKFEQADSLYAAHVKILEDTNQARWSRGH